jgi:hypothetical protein
MPGEIRLSIPPSVPGISPFGHKRYNFTIAQAQKTYRPTAGARVQGCVWRESVWGGGGLSFTRSIVVIFNIKCHPRISSLAVTPIPFDQLRNFFNARPNVQKNSESSQAVFIKKQNTIEIIFVVLNLFSILHTP